MSERQWNSFGVDLMRRDFERRELYQRSGRPELALNLPVRDIEDVHDATFQKRHINPDAWTPRQLLDAARRHGGDAEAEKVWSMMLDNSALGLNRATQTVDDVRKYDDAQLDAASYVGRMTGARIQASQTLPITDPDRIGAPNFSYMYDRQTHSWNTWVSNGEQTVVQPVRDPQQLRELDDTRALRLERQQLRQQFHPDDPYRQQPVLRSPQTLAEADPAHPANAELLAARASDPTLPDHPRHALHQQCVAGTQALDRQLGRSPDAASACMAASLTDLAARSGLERVDRVLLSEGGRNAQAGERVFVVQGDPKDPDHRWAQMPTDEAVHTPVAQSFERLAEFDQQQALAQTQQAAMQQEVQQQAQRQGAVAIRI
ncbi:hypothetical protein KFS86_00390 [Xanthomonas translucens pv. hordei]|nr:hypothetical protein [Xanthomonas translucens pv. translucens]UKE59937.1 hypothetical protein KFS86_00390 [Xanthomonas translucens pv. hordei]QSQ36164.1 hypothetical protein ISN31_16520 [Xanthomonas translucens pv. translucens]QSQ39971.1 hypothetical protein ISN32_17720 [Xanthomonas translucens pv. translucens]UNU13286.1 hypothetical protein KBV71_18400 [Xanthomonas translucens pv. translucens]